MHSSGSFVILRVRAKAWLVSISLTALPDTLFPNCYTLLERVLNYTTAIVSIINIVHAFSVLKFRLLNNLRYNIYIIEVLKEICLIMIKIKILLHAGC
jgi:hypothetical protein